MCCVLGAGSAQAIEKVVGFRDFSFGMSLEEISEVMPMTIAKDYSGDGELYRGGQEIEVAGDAYKVNFLFQDDTLISVALNRDEPDRTMDACRDNVHAKALRDVQSAYGAPDAEPEVSDFGSFGSVDSTFTASDTSQIAVRVLFVAGPNQVSGNCSLLVDYDAPRSGGGF